MIESKTALRNGHQPVVRPALDSGQNENVRPDIMTLIASLNSACERGDVREVSMFLAAMDVIREDGYITDEEGVICFRATCFLLDHPSRSRFRNQMAAASASWHAFMESRKGPVFKVLPDTDMEETHY